MYLLFFWRKYEFTPFIPTLQVYPIILKKKNMSIWDPSEIIDGIYQCFFRVHQVKWRMDILMLFYEVHTSSKWSSTYFKKLYTSKKRSSMCMYSMTPEWITSHAWSILAHRSFMLKPWPPAYLPMHHPDWHESSNGNTFRTSVCSFMRVAV